GELNEVAGPALHAIRHRGRENARRHGRPLSIRDGAGPVHRYRTPACGFRRDGKIIRPGRDGTKSLEVISIRHRPWSDGLGARDREKRAGDSQEAARAGFHDNLTTFALLRWSD